MTTSLNRPAKARTSAFTGHETFHLRQTWISKGLSAIKNRQVNFDDTGAHHELGIGINMLKSLGYWMQATGLARFTGAPKGEGFPFELTDIGQLVAEHDLYLEDIGTLWLIQMELASNKQFAPLWYWVFNLLNTRDFTDEAVFEGYRRFLEDESRSVKSRATEQRDLQCLKRTYAAGSRHTRPGSKEDLLDSPLGDLGLLKESLIPGHYSLRIGGQRTLPLPIFAHSVFKYKEDYSLETSTISTDDLRWAPRSPGRVFCLDGASTLDLLEALDTGTNLIQLTRNEGISQIGFPRDQSSVSILKQYYRGEFERPND